MSNFDWYSEEDIGWDEPARTPPPPRPRRRWPRWLTGLLLLLILGGGAAAGVFRQLSQRVDDVSFELESEVRDSHAIVYRAAETADRDLIVNFLSGRNNRWAAAQEQVTRVGLLYARPGFGLTWVPGDAQLAVRDVVLSPDLTTAVLTATHSYVVTAGPGVTQTVMLDQVSIFRRGPDRWLLSPPDPEYWGAQEVVAGELLTVRYPAHDAALAGRLAADIEAELNKMCFRLSDLNCPETLHVTIELSTNPAALVESNLPGGMTLTMPRMRSLGWFSFPARLTEESRLQVLPTPSLLGLPQDEAGYQALRRGYTARVVSTVIADLSGWRCCDQALLFQALLDVQLVALGLKAPPAALPPLDAFQGIPLQAVAAQWQTNTLMPLQEAIDLLAMTQFLVFEAGASPFEIQRGIASQPAARWLPQVTAGTFATPHDLERAWQRYIYLRSAAVVEPETSWPADALYAACRTDERDGGLLQRYDPTADQFDVQWRLGRQTAFLLPVPGQPWLLVGEAGSGPQPDAVTFLWQGNGTRPIARTAGETAVLPIGASPDGRYAALFQPQGVPSPFVLLDVPACAAGGGCGLTPLAGRPVWSPDGRRMILVGEPSGRADNRLLAVAETDGQASQLAGTGYAPFWLDEARFGYVTDGWRLLFASAETLAAERPLFTFDFTSALPAAEAQRVNGYPIEAAFADRRDVDLIYVVVIAQFVDDGNSYLLAHHRETGESFVLAAWRVDNREVRRYDVSPDGRWFVAWLFDAEEAGWRLNVVDLWQNHTWPVPLSGPPPISDGPFVSWSSDGAWLALSDAGVVHLLAPAERASRRHYPDRMACDQVVWLP